MTRAYQEMYLSNAQSMLGEALDYAMNDCHIPGDTFVKLFVASSVSKRMENGEPNFLAGKSGADMVSDILMETTGKAPQAAPGEHLTRSGEYRQDERTPCAELQRRKADGRQGLQG